MAAQQLQISHTETSAVRASRLLAEAKSAAAEQIMLLEDALSVVAHLSADVAIGGEIYPVGIRDLARKMSDDAIWCATTCSAIRNSTVGRLRSLDVTVAEDLDLLPDTDAASH